MKPGFGSSIIQACIIGATILGSSAVYAETNTYCDNKCGDSQKCKFTCCHITTKRVGGADIITNFNCSSSLCCAHPEGMVSGGSLNLPASVQEGVTGSVKCGLTGTADLDASTIAVETDSKTKTVTLSGTVASPAQRKLAASTAKKQARGYKVINQLTVAK